MSAVSKIVKKELFFPDSRKMRIQLVIHRKSCIGLYDTDDIFRRNAELPEGLFQKSSTLNYKVEAAHLFISLFVSAYVMQ